MIEPPEAPHHIVEHRGKAGKWFDIAMALAVMAVSIGSLYVSLHTGHTMEALVDQNQRLVHAQSTPILQYAHGNYDEGERILSFQVRNVGAGPARIAWARLTHEGKVYRSWERYASNPLQRGHRLELMTSPLAPAVLSAGETKVFFQWHRPTREPDLSAWDGMDRSRFRARATACYCSVFDECWLSNMNGDVPKQVISCENPRAIAPRGNSGH